MKKNQKSAFGRKKYLAAIIPFLMAAQAQSYEFYAGGIEGSFGSEISLGSSWRVEAQDNKFLGGANESEDDGDANFSKGDAFSQVFKGSHELQVSYQNFGGFVRGKYWYDSALADNNVNSGHIPTATVGGQTQLQVIPPGESRLDDSEFDDLSKFSGAQLLDAYVYGEFTLFDMPLDVRLGKQVVSWGESTFIMGGVNAINPVDVNAFTRPGAEIKEVLLPVNMAYFNIGLTDNLSAEAFYQLEYQETVTPGCGTYFSTEDYSAKGCDRIVLPGDVSVARDADGIRRPGSDGQFGLSMRFVSEALGDTEFGLYFMNIHSRAPLVSGVKSPLDLATLGAIGESAYGDYLTAYAVNPLAPTGDEMVAAGAYGQAVTEGNLVATSGYFIDYPEDIQLAGLSFATNIGSVALSGELTHKKDLPIQINGSQLITGSLAGTTQTPELAFLGMTSTVLDAQIESLQPGDTVKGYRTFDVSQLQFTAIQFFDRVLGADRLTLVEELGYTFIHDFEEGADQIKFGRAAFLDTKKQDGFVTQNSWGYRAMLIGEYSDVLAGVTLTPSIAWNHDLKGVAPQPGGSNFIEGQQSFDIAVTANYLSTYKATLSYSQFMGGKYGTLDDRDFASISVGMQF